MDVLSEIIECPVCFERMDTKSKVLPCQHTFCSDCLHRIYIQNKNELRCPECRYVCTIPVRKLPSNILLVRLLEGMSSSGHTISGRREVLRESGQPCAEALYTYEPQEQGDLRFRRGDLIYLKKRLDDNWYIGALNGRSGYLPATYVKVICPFPFPQAKPLPVSTHAAINQSDSYSPAVSPTSTSPIKVTVRALYDFEMKEEEKEDCLKFKKDELIQIIRRVDQNWAEGRLAGVIGIFPLNYVRLTDAAKALLDSSPSRTAARASSRLTHLITNRNRNNSGPAAVGIPTGPTEQTEVSRRSTGSALTVENNSESKTVSAVPQSSFISTDVGGTRPGPATSDGDGSRVRSRSSSDGTFVRADGDCLPLAGKISSHDIYRAMYDYKPQKDDELGLTRGALYHVTDRCKDGWYRGRSLKQGISGVFPGNYVQLIPPDTDGGSGDDAIRTMRRGRLAPPTEKQMDSGSESKGVDSKRSEDGQKFWGMDVMGAPTPTPKMRNAVRRHASARERRRSSSLSRLEHQSTSAIRSTDQPKSNRGRSRHSESTKSSKATCMRYICVMAYPAQDDVEIDLKVGDVVVVLKKKGEGWYKGTNETTGKTGVFPACFVQSFASSSGNESRSS